MQGFLGLLAGFEGSSHWSDWFCDSRLAAWVSIGTVKKQCCFKTTYIILYTVFDQNFVTTPSFNCSTFQSCSSHAVQFPVFTSFPHPNRATWSGWASVIASNTALMFRSTARSFVLDAPVTALPEPKVEPKVEAATATASKPSGVFNGVFPRCLEKKLLEKHLWICLEIASGKLT